VNMKNLLAACLFSGLALTLSAQQPVAPPPKPSNDAPANAEVLKLLQAGMPESVILNKIRATTDKFDTSADALVALKQAGANDAELNAVMAQGSVPAQLAEQPPAAAPADTGPSLAETMQFIRDKLNGLGKVSYVMFFQDTNNSNAPPLTLTYAVSNVVADQSQCRISYHRNATIVGVNATADENAFSLRDVQEIVVKPFEQYQTERSAKLGTPNIIVTSTSPPLTVLIVHLPHDNEYNFRFTDANLADRVAKAMLHAVELCGGGNKEKF